MVLTIENFWKRILPANGNTNLKKELAGWHESGDSLDTFTEAPLSLADYSGKQIQHFKVLLVAAPGAVGKTTLAKQICSETGAVYINLAETGTVGRTTIAGGLALTKSDQAWESGRMGIVIDALDEARLGVTQKGFTDFLKDVIGAIRDQKSGTTYPVLFGRTAVIQDAWILLSDQLSEDEIGVAEIECYDK